MKKRYELFATVSEWTDKATGIKHKRQLQVGTVFEAPSGSLSMHLDAVPVSRDWSGWIAFRDVLPSSSPATTGDPCPTSPP